MDIENGKGRKCSDCSFASMHEKAELLMCQRNPPVMMSSTVRHPMTGQEGIQYQHVFPLVDDSMWCGEFVAAVPGLLAIN